MGRFFGGTKAYSTVGNIEIVFLGRTALTPFETLMAPWVSYASIIGSRGFLLLVSSCPSNWFCSSRFLTR